MGKIKLRFIEHVLDDNGDPVPHPTKTGAWAKHGGQIPLIDENGLPRSVLPGEMFEVDPHIAEDLLRARPGVIVRESDYQKQRVRIERQRDENDAQRYALAGQYQQDKKRRDAEAKLAAQVEQSRRERLADGERQLAPAQPDLSAQLEAMEARLRAAAEEREARDKARIQELERRLAELSIPPAPEPKPEEPKPEEGKSPEAPRAPAAVASSGARSARRADRDIEKTP